MKQQIKIYKVKGNPKNPRIIKDKKFKEMIIKMMDYELIEQFDSGKSNIKLEGEED